MFQISRHWAWTSRHQTWSLFFLSVIKFNIVLIRNNQSIYCYLKVILICNSQWKNRLFAPNSKTYVWKKDNFKCARCSRHEDTDFPMICLLSRGICSNYHCLFYSLSCTGWGNSSKNSFDWCYCSNTISHTLRKWIDKYFFILS